MDQIPATSSQLRSLVDADGTLHLSLQTVDVPVPADDEVLVRVDAAPLNPSDLGLLFGGADMAAATFDGSGPASTVTAQVPPGMLRTMAGRVGESMPVGNEGGGVVVAAGSSPAAQALLGTTVGLLGGAMYSQYRCVQRVAVPRAAGGRHRGRGGGMLRQPAHRPRPRSARCDARGTPRWCTPRRRRTSARCSTGCASPTASRSSTSFARRSRWSCCSAAGAAHVCDSSADSFIEDLDAALTATGATIAFDAIGGGRLAGQILSCMETAAIAAATEYSRYGSTTHKQVYIYGGLDRGPTEINRNFGMAWSIGGWLLTPVHGHGRARRGRPHAPPRRRARSRPRSPAATPGTSRSSRR